MLHIVNPRQTVLITSKAEIDYFGKKIVKDNVLAIDWHTPLSFSPMMYAFSVSKNRFSYELIKKSKVFVVNFMPHKHEKAVLHCGRNSGRHSDKFAEAGLTKEKSNKVDCPRVKEALAHLECEVFQEIETGDHVLILANILDMEEKSEDKRIFHITGNDFGTIG